MALCTSGRGFRGNTCPTMTRRQAAHQALNLQSRPTRLGPRNSQQASSARASSTPRFPRPPPWRLPSASGTTVQVPQYSGETPRPEETTRILSRENYYVSDPPVRAGFSIFCQTKIPLSSIAKPGSEGSVQSGQGEPGLLLSLHCTWVLRRRHPGEGMS